MFSPVRYSATCESPFMTFPFPLLDLTSFNHHLRNAQGGTVNSLATLILQLARKQKSRITPGFFFSTFLIIFIRARGRRARDTRPSPLPCLNPSARIPCRHRVLLEQQLLFVQRLAWCQYQPERSW